MPKINVQLSAEAKKLHANLCKKSATEEIYTDGSDIKNKVGAAAFRPGINEAIRQHLESRADYNVFTAELAAMCLSATIVQENKDSQTWNIYTDRQAAIQAVNRPFRQSDQSVIKEFIDTIDTVTTEKSELQITLVWVPGHSEIEGNEIADAEAKKAATDPDVAILFNHKPLRSAGAQSIKAAAKAQWFKD